VSILGVYIHGRQIQHRNTDTCRDELCDMRDSPYYINNSAAVYAFVLLSLASLSAEPSSLQLCQWLGRVAGVVWCDCVHFVTSFCARKKQREPLRLSAEETGTMKVAVFVHQKAEKGHPLLLHHMILLNEGSINRTKCWIPHANLNTQTITSLHRFRNKR
jgi:hypothetical protein